MGTSVHFVVRLPAKLRTHDMGAYKMNLLEEIGLGFGIAIVFVAIAWWGTPYLYGSGARARYKLQKTRAKSERNLIELQQYALQGKRKGSQR